MTTFQCRRATRSLFRRINWRPGHSGPCLRRGCLRCQPVPSRHKRPLEKLLGMDVVPEDLNCRQYRRFFRGKNKHSIDIRIKRGRNHSFKNRGNSVTTQSPTTPLVSYWFVRSWGAIGCLVFCSRGKHMAIVDVTKQRQTKAIKYAGVVHIVMLMPMSFPPSC